MRRTSFALAVSTSFSALLLSAAGCAPGSEEPPSEAGAAAPSPIINGQLDTTHTAVVAVLGNNFSCSGTIVQVKNGVGYVLTAAHCCPAGNPPKWVVAANDYNINFNQSNPAPPAYLIIPSSVKRDGCYLDYPESTDDVCMFKFSNATGLPTMPVAVPPDGLAVGQNLTYVGYGITSSPPGGFNSKRRSVTKPIGQLDYYFIEYANPGASGTCEGDSGGPALATINGTETVVGVTSYGDQACTQLGASDRTQAVYQSFIAPYLADMPQDPSSCPVDTDCNICFGYAAQQGACTAATDACINDTQCNALVNCYAACTTTACQNQCNDTHLAGLPLYVAIENCVCNTGCVSACGSTSFCTTPKCGYKVPDASCKACIDTSCCEESWTCAGDATCKKCFGTNPLPACATDAAANAFYQCATTKCGCSIPDPANAGTTSATTTSGTGGAGGSGAGGAPGTTTTAGAGGANVKPADEGCSVGERSRPDGGAALAILLALGAATSLRRRRA